MLLSRIRGSGTELSVVASGGLNSRIFVGSGIWYWFIRSSYGGWENWVCNDGICGVGCGTMDEEEKG